MKHLVVLGKIKAKFESDENVLAVLVFGSVANQTHHEKSDIDLSVIYKLFKPGFEFTTGLVDGIKIGYSSWSIGRLKERASTSPYRMYVFAHAKLLFDKGKVKNVQKNLLEYFASHREVQKTWEELNENYAQEKKQFGAGRTNIFDLYEELDKKYST